MDARIREFSQERELYPPHARIAQTKRTQCVCPFHDVLRYTQDMFAKMTELGLPLPRDEKRRMLPSIEIDRKRWTLALL